MRTLFRKFGQIGWSFPIILALSALCFASIFVILSATYGNEGLRDAPLKQLYYIFAGFAVYFTIALIPYQWLVRISPILYGVAVLMLIGVFIPGLRHKVYGAYSWLDLHVVRFEPAEFAKIAFVLAMVWFLRVRENQMHSIWTVLIALGFTLVPFALIKEQPALGSAGVFIPVFFIMVFIAGARLRHLLLIIFMGAVAGGLYLWVSTHLIKKPDVAGGVKNFQMNRIKSWMDPSLDKQGAAWQINQSLITIGSGGMYGKVPVEADTFKSLLGALAGKTDDVKSWMVDTQTGMGYLPKNTSYNDLIFSVVGELFGFRGGAALIICEGTVLLWCIWVAAHARDKTGALLAVGVMTMLFAHIFVNIGMTIQVVPITGIPLPFVSYGGTFLIACLAAMGLVQSVWVHRKNFERI